MWKKIFIVCIGLIVLFWMKTIFVWYPGAQELQTISTESKRFGLTKQEHALVIAIRIQERGGTGYEYGVRDARGRSYKVQLDYCIRTILNNKVRFMVAHKYPVSLHRIPPNDFRTFIIFLGNRYCPIDDPGDKQKINRYWIPFVLTYWTQIIDNGLEDL